MCVCVSVCVFLVATCVFCVFEIGKTSIFILQSHKTRLWKMRKIRENHKQTNKNFQFTLFQLKFFRKGHPIIWQCTCFCSRWIKKFCAIVHTAQGEVQTQTQTWIKLWPNRIHRHWNSSATDRKSIRMNGNWLNWWLYVNVRTHQLDTSGWKFEFPFPFPFSMEFSFQIERAKIINSMEHKVFFLLVLTKSCSSAHSHCKIWCGRVWLCLCIR